MKTKLYIVSSIIFAAIGLSLFLSPSAHAAPICGDSDFTGACPNPVPACGDKTFIGPCGALDYSTVNCDTAFKNSYEGPSRCRAVKQCITQRGLTSATCVQQWNTCRDGLADAQGKMKSADREGCMTAVQTGTPYTPAGTTDGTKTTCNIEGIGWILCPVMRFLAQLIDQAYGMVGLMLAVPAVDTSTNSPLYSAWSVMRNFANAAFVMAFLIIIYSQMTGAGINNYGIKKMLPKLIVSAILVNVSYWLCAIAVDVSNIVGSSVKGMLEGTSNQLYVPGGSGVESGKGGLWDGLTLTLLAGGTVAVILYVGLSALLPMLISAAFAIATAVVVLTLRQALIIILIAISPIPFVARLFPNTESVFSIWYGTGKILLIIYPAAGLVFGGSALASTIIMISANGNFILQVTAAGVTVIPLFMVPALTKLIDKGFSRVGIRLNDPGKGPVDGLKRRAEGFRNNRQQLRDANALNGKARVGGFMVRRNARKQAVLAQRERNYNNAKSAYIADASLDGSKSAAKRALETVSGGRYQGKTRGDALLDKMAKGGGDGARSAALAQALTVQAKLEAEEVQAASATIKALNLTQSEKRTLANGGTVTTASGQTLQGGEDVALQRAGMQSVIDSNDIRGINDLVDNSRGWAGEDGQKLRQSLADSLGSSSSKPNYLGQGDLETIRQGTNTLSADEFIEKAIQKDVYSADKIAMADKDELNEVARVAATSSNISVADHQKIINNAHAALTDPILNKKVGKNLGNVTNLRNNVAPTKLP